MKDEEKKSFNAVLAEALLRLDAILDKGIVEFTLKSEGTGMVSLTYTCNHRFDVSSDAN